MTRLRIVLALAAAGALSLGLGVESPARAQQNQFESLEALDEHYRTQYEELERNRLTDLQALAERLSGDEVEDVYREIFHLALVQGMFDQAEEAADAYLQREGSESDIRALATFIKIVAEANRGEHDQALRHLRAFLGRQGGDRDAHAQSIYAIGEPFIQHLIRDGRYDTARTVSQLLIEGSPDPQVKEHFQTRLERLDMLGEPAPPIVGPDVDGTQFNMAEELEGKVILVDFWATWCTPCIAAMPHLASLYQRYHDRGFEIVGVNVDSLREGVEEHAQVLPLVRRFLIDFRVPWTNVVSGLGEHDLAKAYGVADIPANFLIDRDGKIIHVELSGDELEEAIVQALGESR